MYIELYTEYTDLSPLCHCRGCHAAPAGIDPSNGDHVEEMILLYRSSP
ncbi:MAG: hypothetical protein GY859_13520 [Desulfobacterales bacterium]|nr:hypothetical protein [Desulfobacterales bacterium]